MSRLSDALKKFAMRCTTASSVDDIKSEQLDDIMDYVAENYSGGGTVTGGVVDSVNGKRDKNVVINGEDINVSSSDTTTIAEALADIDNPTWEKVTDKPFVGVDDDSIKVDADGKIYAVGGSSEGGIVDSVNGKHESDVVLTGEDINVTTDTTSKTIASTLNAKQDTLIAGDNITIKDNVISATGGTGSVISVNGKDGEVTLDGTDIKVSDDDTRTISEALIDIDNPLWANIQNKPFTTIDNNSLLVNEGGELYVSIDILKWEYIQHRPFYDFDGNYFSIDDEGNVKIKDSVLQTQWNDIKLKPFTSIDNDTLKVTGEGKLYVAIDGKITVVPIAKHIVVDGINVPNLEVSDVEFIVYQYHEVQSPVIIDCSTMYSHHLVTSINYESPKSVSILSDDGSAFINYKANADEVTVTVSKITQPANAWSSIVGKPFEMIDNDTLIDDDGVLKVNDTLYPTKVYVDELATETLANSKVFALEKDELVLTAAKQYTDTHSGFETYTVSNFTTIDGVKVPTIEVDMLDEIFSKIPHIGIRIILQETVVHVPVGETDYTYTVLYSEEQKEAYYKVAIYDCINNKIIVYVNELGTLHVEIVASDGVNWASIGNKPFESLYGNHFTVADNTLKLSNGILNSIDSKADIDDSAWEDDNSTWSAKQSYSEINYNRNFDEYSADTGTCMFRELENSRWAIGENTGRVFQLKVSTDDVNREFSKGTDFLRFEYKIDLRSIPGHYVDGNWFQLLSCNGSFGFYPNYESPSGGDGRYHCYPIGMSCNNHDMSVYYEEGVGINCYAFFSEADASQGTLIIRCDIPTLVSPKRIAIIDSEAGCKLVFTADIVCWGYF